MARYLFRLPDIGEGVAEAEIVAWYVKPGDQVSEDQSLVDVMTDKATVDIASPVDGRVMQVHGAVGDKAPVGSVLVELEVAGEEGAAERQTDDAPAPPSRPADPPTAPAAAPPKAAETAATRPPERATASEPAWRTRPAGEPPLASPATRRRAHELGIELQYVPGSGPGGRITPQDLENYIAHGAGPAVGDLRYLEQRGVHETPLIGLRRRIAERMQESKRRIPHFGYVEEFDVTELEALRAEMNATRGEGRPKLTLLPFFMRGLVRALPEFPHINARFDDEAGVLQQFDGVHVGIATQTPGGLMVPVVRHAEARDIWGCAGELLRVTSAARSGAATRDELSGSTITLTSLGTLGGIAATPVINHPEVAIIGPNKLVERPMIRDGQIVVRKMMNVSSSFDHRIVDGYDAARFIHALKRLVETPALIFTD